MANPNIVNVSSILGRIVTVNLTGTTATQITSNAASSNKIFKINSLIVANINASTATNITINHYSAAALGGTATEIAGAISVPANASLIVIDKGNSIYLEENMSLGAIAGAANNLKIVCSFEEIS